MIYIYIESELKKKKKKEKSMLPVILVFGMWGGPGKPVSALFFPLAARNVTATALNDNTCTLWSARCAQRLP